MIFLPNSGLPACQPAAEPGSEWQQAAVSTCGIWALNCMGSTGIGTPCRVFDVLLLLTVHLCPVQAQAACCLQDVTATYISVVRLHQQLLSLLRLSLQAYSAVLEVGGR